MQEHWKFKEILICFLTFNNVLSINNKPNNKILAGLMGVRNISWVLFKDVTHPDLIYLKVLLESYIKNERIGCC